MKEFIKLNYDYLKKNAPDFDAIILETVSSTNSYAKDKAKEQSRDLIVVAEEQTNGKGRLDRKFYSTRGEGLYVSFLIHPTIPMDKLMLITPAVAVIVSDVVDKLSKKETKIKWVNDIYLNGKKICGILTESITKCDRVNSVIVGIGINVSNIEFPKDIDSFASSVLIESGVTLDRNIIVCEIAKRLKNLEQIIKSRSFLTEYRQKSNIIGRYVEINGETVLVKAINDDCSLTIEKDGKLISFLPDEISLHK